MRTRGAIVRETPGAWEVVDIELDGPRRGEVTVELAACGLCHTEVAVANGDLAVDGYPVCGGHEGAGVVVEIGPETSGWAVGDHLVISGIPSCGRCRFCAMGESNLCELSGSALTGARYDDPSSFRMSVDGQPINQFCGISCFAELTTIDVRQAIKIPADVPLEKACVIGCAGLTGWGSMVRLAEPQPGDTVIVAGIGGIGTFAILGAAQSSAANIIACDSNSGKSGVALGLGATHFAPTIAAAGKLARELTDGRGADATVIAIAMLDGRALAEAVRSLRRGGTCVLASIAPPDLASLPINLLEFTLSQKRLQGSLYGGTAPFRDIPILVESYRAGKLDLDAQVTATYSLSEVNRGYDDLEAGGNVRGVISFAR